MSDDEAKTAEPKLAQVIELKPGDFPLQRGESKRSKIHGRHCAHLYVLVDAGARELECKSCGASVDPIAWIDILARDPEWIRHARREKEALVKEVDSLKDEVKKLKAARRRASESVAGAAARVVAAVRSVVQYHKSGCNCPGCIEIKAYDLAIEEAAR